MYGLYALLAMYERNCMRSIQAPHVIGRIHTIYVKYCKDLHVDYLGEYIQILQL
jgi:hypothetical protein